MADKDPQHQDRDGIRAREAHTSRNATPGNSDNTFNIKHCTVKIFTGNNDNYPSPSPAKKVKQLRLQQQAELEFLAKVKLHLSKAMDAVRHLKSRPTAMVVETDSGMVNAAEMFPVDAKNHLGRDVKEIDLEQIHDPMENKSSRHVMILGETGAGKSTFSKMYSLAVSERNVTALHAIKLVHFVHAATLQFQTPSSAFHLFFIDQLAQCHDTELTPDQEKSGREWLVNNSDKVLIIIDGLDQCLEDFSTRKYSTISEKTPAKANDLIANIMSGRIWHLARILTSSCWNIYWRLKADQKPDKVIALRGFDDENLETAALNLSTDGSAMLEQLRHTSPAFLGVCRNPMFLTYMTSIYKSHRGSLPDKISGLMSAVFRNFLRSYDIGHFKNITKLAYNGMLDNLFAIPYSNVEKLGIKPADLNNFCSPGAILEKGCDNVTSHDTFYVFSHQTMQEFCCALHVLNLKKNEIEEFVANGLNESRMTLTRLLLYGLIMNEKVTDPMRNYLNCGVISIDDCRNILFSQLQCMIANGTLCDMQTIHMINECGNDIVREIKNDVHRIIINDGDLVQSDHILLATMTKSLSPIREVRVWRFTLQRSVIQCLKDCLASADLCKIQILRIAGKSMTEVGYAELAYLLKVTTCNELQLEDCNLNKNKLDLLRKAFEKENVKIPKLVIVDKSMTEDGYEELANLLNVTKCNELQFLSCDLNRNKMAGLSRKCDNGKVEIHTLAISDKLMTEDGYGELANLLNITKCQELTLGFCDLNMKKLNGLRQEFIVGNVKIQRLGIVDKSMAEDGYGELANLLNVTKCNELSFQNCDLNKKKMAGLLRKCENGNVEIQKLGILDKSMTEDGYGELPSLLNVLKCSELLLIDCDLNKNKLAELSEECKKGNVKIQKLVIVDKSMIDDGYGELAHLFNVTKCNVLHLEDCDLNKKKLGVLLKEFVKLNVKIQKLVIVDKAMTEDGYGELAHLLNVTKCNELHLEDCDLNKKKLGVLQKEFVKGNVTIQRLVIVDKSMTEDGYGELANLLNVTKCIKLHLLNCDLSKNKLAELFEECQKVDVKIQKLAILDKSMTEDGYGELANLLNVTKCIELWLVDCDLNKSKLAELSEECQKGNVKIPKLIICDKLMTVDGFRELSNVVNVTECAHLHLIHCDLNKSKLAEIVKECEYGNIKKMYNLDIYENHSTASDEEVSALCELMSNSLSGLGLHDWEIDARGIQILKETFQHEASQMVFLRLPDGESISKHQWMEQL